MNVEQIWELVKGSEVGGESGRSDVVKVLNSVWLEEAATHSFNAKNIGRILSALDNRNYELITPDDLVFLEYGLVKAGFGELVKLMS